MVAVRTDDGFDEKKGMEMAYNPRASMPGKPTNAGYAQTTLASGKGEGFVQPKFLGPSRKAAATRTRNRNRKGRVCFDVKCKVAVLKM